MRIQEIITESDSDSDDKTYEAIIKSRHSDRQRHVTIEAEDFFDAEDQIIARYCDGDEDGIIEGPWIKHKSH